VVNKVKISLTPKNAHASSHQDQVAHGGKRKMINYHTKITANRHTDVTRRPILTIKVSANHFQSMDATPP